MSKVLMIVMQGTDLKRVVWTSILKTVLSIVLIAGLFLLLKHTLYEHVIGWLDPFITKPMLMFFTFFLSEALIGILPPDFYIIWTFQYETPTLLRYLTYLALLSYIGGLVAYMIGNSLTRNRYFFRYMVRYYKNYFQYIRKWGGLVVLLAAMTPLPFSPISMIAGGVRFPFKQYAGIALMRIVRFYLYAWVFWEVLVG